MSDDGKPNVASDSASGLDGSSVGEGSQGALVAEDGEVNAKGSLGGWHDFESQYSLAMEQSVIFERETWGSQLEFLMSCIASAVGLGNIWRFPFVCGQNGGGAFLLPYMIVLFIIARPMYMLELGLGQFVSGGPVKIWEMCPAFRGVGYMATTASFCLGSFYLVVMGWSIAYCVYSCFETFPWQQEYFTPPFLETRHTKKIPGVFFGIGHLGVPLKDDNETEFHQGKGLDGPPVILPAAGLLVAWLIVWLNLFIGVSGLGKVAYFNALFPYAVLLTLMVGGFTLKGYERGLYFFFIPNFQKIASGKAWFQAVGQCFFSLGISFGGTIMFSSYNNFRHKLGRDIIVISIMDTFTSLLAGTCMFSLLGNIDYLNEQEHLKDPSVKRQTVENLAESAGAGMAFAVFPQVLPSFGGTPGPQIFALLFFGMIVILSLGSANGIIGTLVTVLCDAFPKWGRRRVVTGIAIVSFIVGVMYTCPTGSNIMDIVDIYGTQNVAYFIGICEVFGIIYIYGLQNIRNDFEFMLGSKLNYYWVVNWAVLPPLLTMIFGWYLLDWKDTKNPLIAIICGWGLTLSQMLIFFLTILIVICTRKSRFMTKRVKAAFLPTRKWGPKDPATREAWRRWKKTRPSELRFRAFIMKALGCRKYKQGEEIQPYWTDPDEATSSIYQAASSDATPSTQVLEDASSTTQN